MDGAAYLDQLQQLLPPGAAWPRDPDATLTQLLAAIAAEFARLDDRAERLVEEADPRTALELLPDWERLAGLPDACTGVLPTTVPERRAAIVTKLTARGGQSSAYLTALAATLGYPIAITELAALRSGGRCGTRANSAAWGFAFRVDLLPPAGSVDPSIVDRRLRAGAGRAGERLRSYGSPALECVIRRAAPAHAAVIFAYPASPAPAFFFDFTQG